MGGIEGCVGAFCSCASATNRMIRASVVSPVALVTSISSEPSPLIVPAKTSSPGFLSTGTDSPVIGAWFNGRLSREHNAIEGNTHARPGGHGVADRHLING